MVEDSFGIALAEDDIASIDSAASLGALARRATRAAGFDAGGVGRAA